MSQKILIFFVILFLSAGYLFGQNKGKICGYIKDVTTGKPLSCANVSIKSTNIGASTDTKGYFCIQKIPAGTYELTATIIGYKTVTKKDILVSENGLVNINFELKSEPVKLKEVTVTATRGYDFVTDVPVSTTIITSVDLQQQAYQNVGDALESTGSVYIKNYGDIAGLKTASIRGSADGQVLVLLDGQRLNNSQNASFDFSSLPVDAVEKIEIVKGGHSALYGANAVGGVVNIISKNPAPGRIFTSAVNSTFGSQGTQIQSFNSSQEIGKFSSFLSLKHVRSDGDYEFEDNLGQIKRLENNDLKSKYLFFKLNYEPLMNSNLTFSTQINEIEQGLAGSISYFTPKQRKDKSTNLCNLAYTGFFFNRLQLRTNAYYHRSDENVVDLDSWSTPYSRHLNKALGLELQNRFLLNKNIVFTFGYDFRYDKLSSTQIVDNKERKTNSVYLQGELENRLNNLSYLNKVKIIPAIRFDSYSDIGNKTSPKLGLVFSKEGAVTASLKGNIGKSFRSPTFNDLYWAEEWMVGNPDLKPEIGINYDAGTILQYDTEYFSTNFEVTYFVNNLEDLIIWVPRDDGKWTPQNVDKSKTKGTESNIGFDLFNHKINFGIAHTYMSAKNNSENSSENGKYLIYHPKHKVDLSMDFQYQIFRLYLMARYVDKSYTSPDNTQSIPAYRVFDFGIGATPLLFGVKLLTKVDVLNAFDDQFVVIKDYPVPGRQFRFTVGIKF